MLNIDDKKFLLKTARNAIRKAAGLPEEDIESNQNPFLTEKHGLFVTLHHQGELRGCIGYTEGPRSILETVREMAVAAAFEDPRFTNVSPAEIADLQIEISILSPLKRIRSVKEIRIGEHGIVIERGIFKGLLLPQVAAEKKWDRNQFLEHTCLKAGLQRDIWKYEGTVIQIFSADIFSEETY